MATPTDRLERMTNLVLVLLSTNHPLSLREIGQVVAGYPKQPGAIRQAFERDKRTLRDSGIVITVERLGTEDQVGYRIRPEDYYLPDLGLSDEERAALVFALVAVRIEGGVGNEIAHKLGSPANAEAVPIAVLPVLKALAPLQTAIRDRGVVEFSYRGRNRSVEGYGLVFARGSWYLVGRDTEVEGESGIRSYRVDRIEGDPSAGPDGAFEVPETFDLRSATRFSPFLATDEIEDPASNGVVELLVDVREASGVVALVGERSVRRRSPDGSVVVTFPIGDEEAFFNWILGLGDAVEVLGPKNLREATIGRLRKAAMRGQAQ